MKGTDSILTHGSFSLLAPSPHHLPPGHSISYTKDGGDQPFFLLAPPLANASSSLLRRLLTTKLTSVISSSSYYIRQPLFSSNSPIPSYIQQPHSISLFCQPHPTADNPIPSHFSANPILHPAALIFTSIPTFLLLGSEELGSEEESPPIFPFQV